MKKLVPNLVGNPEKEKGVQRTQCDRGQVRTGQTGIWAQQHKGKAERHVAFMDRSDPVRHQPDQVRRTARLSLLTF